MVRENWLLQSGFARAGSGFRPRDREHIGATTSCPSGREVGRPLCGRVPTRPQLPPCAPNAAARVRREDSSSRRRARLGSVRHLSERKISRTLRFALWRTHPVHMARIWHLVPGIASRESPNHAFCSKNARSCVFSQRSDSFSRPCVMIPTTRS